MSATVSNATPGGTSNGTAMESKSSDAVVVELARRVFDRIADLCESQFQSSSLRPKDSASQSEVDTDLSSAIEAERKRGDTMREIQQGLETYPVFRLFIEEYLSALPKPNPKPLASSPPPASINSTASEGSVAPTAEMDETADGEEDEEEDGEGEEGDANESDNLIADLYHTIFDTYVDATIKARVSGSCHE